jgi:NAD(P)-dependent dehydrogenase (short-subunit alcohol dehydrogenase family)
MNRQPGIPALQLQGGEEVKNLLLARLAAAPGGARVINTASNVYRRARLDLDDLDGTRRGYRNQQAYPASKLATILFTQELARRTRGTGVTASAFHPGLVATDLGRDSPVFRLMNSWLGRIILSTPRRGAEPLLHLATIADPQAVNGAYLNRLKPEDPANEQARDPNVARQLWERSAQLTGLNILPRQRTNRPGHRPRENTLLPGKRECNGVKPQAMPPR